MFIFIFKQIQYINTSLSEMFSKKVFFLEARNTKCQTCLSLRHYLPKFFIYIEKRKSLVTLFYTDIFVFGTFQNILVYL